MNRTHVLLFWLSFLCLFVATLIAADVIDSSYLAAWVLGGAASFVAAHATKES